MQAFIHTVLSETGRLSNVKSNFEFRSQQLQMSLDTARMFEQRTCLLAEAGTGTGKSLAYLLPAALWEHNVMISTGTKNLQEQLYFQDIPLLNRLLDNPVKAVLMKGRQNYICWNRWEHAEISHGMIDPLELSLLPKITEWLKTTQTGDQSELSFLPDQSRLWRYICSRNETCLGSRCHYNPKCFVLRMKMEAQNAKLVIVNHHLFFADLIFRQQRMGAVLPNVDGIIFDEAHLLDEVATEAFGIRISLSEILDLLTLLSDWKPKKTDRKTQWKLSAPMDAVKSAASMFFDFFGKGEGRFLLEKKYNKDASRLAGSLIDSLNELAITIKQETGIPGELQDEYSAKISEFTGAIKFLNSQAEPDFVYWFEHAATTNILHANPLDIASDFSRSILNPQKPVLFTSATLTANDCFDHIVRRLGLGDVERKIYPSPYHYTEQAILYLPEHLPDPGDQAFFQTAAEEIVRLLEITRGRAFVLCTSYRGMNAIRSAIKDRLDYTLIVQGDAPRNVLVERFREDTHSVLLATSSFWQGIDVPGESLSCVIIDKLPFAAPSDPITDARIRYMRSNGREPFKEYQLPEAIVVLKQGVGRLIRSRTDKGMVAILDRRLTTKSYGNQFLRSLPDFQRVKRLQEVRDFFRSV